MWPVPEHTTPGDNTATQSPGQHADPYLIDAEAQARRAFHGDRGQPIPAHQWSAAGLRILTVVDLPIGCRVNVGLNQPATLIGGSSSHAIVRTDDGRVWASELCELSLCDEPDSDAYSQCLPLGMEDRLSHLGHLLAELQQAHTDDGLTPEEVDEARRLAGRVAKRLEAACAEAFSSESGRVIGGAA